MSTNSPGNLQPKKAPLAQAIREFVTAIEFPPCDGDQNFKYSGLILALLQFSGHLTIESKSATCTPSLPTIARLMHCNEKTIRRQITSLEKLGLITSRRRLRKPNVYTVWKNLQIGQQVSTQETEQSEPRLDSRCPDRPESRLDNPAALNGQDSTPDRTTTVSRLDTKGVLIGQQVSNIGVKPIGSTSEGYTPIGNKPEGSESSPDVLSNHSPVRDQPQRQGFDSRRIDVHIDKAQESLDEAMELYRESNPAYAKLANSLMPEEERQALDDVVLARALDAALEICNILGESIGNKTDPRQDWQAFCVRLQAACGPTVTVQQICDTVQRLTDNGMPIHSGMSAVDFANLANAPGEPEPEPRHCKICDAPSGLEPTGGWTCDNCDSWNTGEEAVPEAAATEAGAV